MQPRKKNAKSLSFPQRKFLTKQARRYSSSAVRCVFVLPIFPSGVSIAGQNLL
ncbi:hypothetical protein PORCRE_529 [Porphyromonas crevioricanis JCM 15906]|uniref:Uncharacterized protein n=1 Tax=Porphyromonas crevioricanis JCM 15906 TaxID=1305617 RepID=S4N9G1_9PORP|nr:hypothetical protein PORCRE_529 [Porphyromonas crevioricanis JCM 15906]